MEIAKKNEYYFTSELERINNNLVTQALEIFNTTTYVCKPFCE